MIDIVKLTKDVRLNQGLMLMSWLTNNVRPNWGWSKYLDQESNTKPGWGFNPPSRAILGPEIILMIL